MANDVQAIMRYIVSCVFAFFLIAYLVPIGMSELFNGSGTWTGDIPTVVYTLLTTVVSIFFAIGVAVALMPDVVKSKVGLWYTPAIPKMITIPENSAKIQTRKVFALSHFEGVG